MTSILKKNLVVGMGLILLLSLPFIIPIPKQDIENRIYADDIAEYCEDGDIICRLGDRLWSALLQDLSTSDKRFSHLGIIRVVDNVISVINAEGTAINGEDFVKEIPLEEFLTFAKSIGIYRFVNYTETTLSDVAVEYVGYPYDWTFDLFDDSKLYCTELLYAVIRKIAPDIKLQTVFQKEISTELVPLEAVSNSEYFKEIIYIANFDKKHSISQREVEIMQ